MKEQTWFEKLGYKQNPFMIKPYAFGDQLAGYKVQIRKVNTTLKRGRVIFIEGEYGVGKTSVLKQIIDEFKGKRKLIYYSANRVEGGIDFDALIKGRAGIIGRLFGYKPKNLILMIDEAQKLNLHDCHRIEALIKTGYFKSVVFVSDSYSKVKLTPGLKHMIGGRILNLGEALSENQAVKIVKNRMVKTPDFIQPRIAKMIFEKAGKNPRRMLEYLEEVSRYAVDEKSHERVTEEDVAAVLG